LLWVLSTFTGPVPLPPTLRGPGQSRSADTLAVTAGVLDTTPISTRDLAAALAEEPFIPAHDPAMLRQAVAIVGDERDPARASGLLVQWIAREIHTGEDDDVRLVPPSTTLAHRTGDRSARVLLFVTLARAARIPARPVSGLLLTPRGFAFHAWAEVRTASGWLAVDPGLGQPVADAGRLRLVADRLGREADLVWRAGALRPISLDRTDTR
jgi:transglutaminase-like putative cysteine protease